MPERTEKLPLDARLLSNAVIELNISRHIISLYPGNHGLVEKALGRAFGFLGELFDLRSRITLAVAKDTLIVDKRTLDRKNPVFREFALSLSRMGIAHVTFIKGLKRGELQAFHRFLSSGREGLTAEDFSEALAEYDLNHIVVEPIDYRTFSFEEGKAAAEGTPRFLTERYIKGLLEGTLLPGDAAEAVEGIPPELLAGIFNEAEQDALKEKTYDTVITSYLRGPARRAFTGKNLRRLLDFIAELRPELKKEFLSSSVKSFSGDMDALNSALDGITVDRIIDLLRSFNEQNVTLPEPLRNLLNKFAGLDENAIIDPATGLGTVADDIELTPEIMGLFREDTRDRPMSAKYEEEIRKLLSADLSRTAAEVGRAYAPEWREQSVRSYYVHALLEMLSSELPNLIGEGEERSFLEALTKAADQFAESGEYHELHELLMRLEELSEGSRDDGIARSALSHCHSREFVGHLASSFANHGRRARVEAALLCDYYGAEIVPPLLRLLGAERSQGVRKFLIGMLAGLGKKVHPEALKRIADRRWYVRRNILYLLAEVGAAELLPSLRPFCADEDPRVRLEAARCFIGAGEEIGTETLRSLFEENTRNVAEQAIQYAGTLKVRALIPDLTDLLGRSVVRRRDYNRKIAIVRALGTINDPRARPALEGALQSRGVLFKEGLERLKVEVEKALRFLSPEENEDGQ